MPEDTPDRLAAAAPGSTSSNTSVHMRHVVRLRMASPLTGEMPVLPDGFNCIPHGQPSEDFHGIWIKPQRRGHTY